MKKYSIAGYPTFIALNSKGETINRWAGYDRTGWLANTDDTVKDPTTMGETTARVNATPNETEGVTLDSHVDSGGK